MPKGIPFTEEEQSNRRHEIFHKVVHVFPMKGFRETSMRKIAVSAGLGKSTLYDYFKMKDEILLYIFEDQIMELTVAAMYRRLILIVELLLLVYAITTIFVI